MQRRRWKSTSIALESAWWTRLDSRAAAQGVSWRELCSHLLASKPEDRNNASWIREMIM